MKARLATLLSSSHARETKCSCHARETECWANSLSLVLSLSLSLSLSFSLSSRERDGVLGGDLDKGVLERRGGDAPRLHHLE